MGVVVVLKVEKLTIIMLVIIQLLFAKGGTEHIYWIIWKVLLENLKVIFCVYQLHKSTDSMERKWTDTTKMNWCEENICLSVTAAICSLSVALL